MAKLEAKLRRKLTKAELQEIDMDTLFHYKVGDLVLRRRKALGKLESRAEGPYRVVAVGGSFLQRITIKPEAVLVGPRRGGTRRETLVVHAS